MKRVLVALIVLTTMVVGIGGPASALDVVVVDGIKVARQTDGDINVTGTGGDDPVIDVVTNPDDNTMIDIFIGETLAMTNTVKDLTITTGSGDDAVVVRASDATYTIIEDGASTSSPNNPDAPTIANLVLKMGADNDLALVLGVNVTGNATVDLGAADLGPIAGRRDNDEAVVSGLNAGQNFSLRGKANKQVSLQVGNTVGGLVSVDLGSGDSRHRIINNEFSRFEFTGGSGVDEVFVIATDLGDAPIFLTSGGDDRILYSNSSHAGKAVFGMGSGNDTVFNADGHFFFNGGDGNDNLSVAAGADPDSVANGGPGTGDRISGGAGITFSNFEIIN